MMNYIQVIKRYFQNLPVTHVYLFGSYAYNTQTECSDIDLMVEIDYSQKQVSLLDFIGWKLDLEKLTGKKIDLVSEDGVSKYIRPFIDKEKILLYEKSDGR
jgi:hypothetical protein